MTNPRTAGSLKRGFVLAASVSMLLLAGCPEPDPPPGGQFGGAVPEDVRLALLVVDDQPDIVTYLEALLEDNGYEVLTAYDGNEGIEKAKEHRPDLIFLDLMMPNIDGWEVLQLLKSNPETEGIPVCLLTAKGDIRNKMYALQQGAADYITKPFRREELLKKVESITAN